MIVMIDHLAFGSLGVDEDLGRFREFGYEAAFIERNLRDIGNKRPFMSHFGGQLDMALLKRQGSLSIELLDHGHTVSEGSYLHPVLEGVTHDLERLDDSLVVSETTFVKVRSEMLRAAFFVQEGPVSPDFSCRKVIADANDLEQSAAFWNRLGFKSAGVADGVTQLRFRSPLGGDCEMYLREKRNGSDPPLLDDHGFNCIAFFSSDTKKDRQKFERLDMQPTEADRFHVGGKDLAIFWLRGPGREVVEVIGLA